MLGTVSQARILGSETWWNKHFSAQNSAVAQLINRTDRPLVIAAPGDVGTGELISLAYHLDPRVRIWGQGYDDSAAVELSGGFDALLLLLLPSHALRDRLESHWIVTPVEGTWHWWIARPRVP
jgi:hypothetical protein